MRKKVNKMKKNTLLFTGLLGILVLSGCRNAESEIATMRGGKVTADDFFQSAAFVDPKLGRSSSRSRKQLNEQILQEMILKQVFTQKYGNQVSDAMIEEAYLEQVGIYGGREQFQEVLEMNGLTKKAFDEMTRESLSIEIGLKEHMEIGDSELDNAWDNFYPTVEIQLIQVSDEVKANEVLEEVKRLPEKFEEIVKEESEHEKTAENEGYLSFDSLSDEIPSEVKNVAFSLKDEEISELVTVVDSSTYQTNYYIIKMISNKGKGNDRDVYLDELTKLAQETFLSDPEFVLKRFGEELKEADVEIKAEQLNDLLSEFLKKESSEKSE